MRAKAPDLLPLFRSKLQGDLLAILLVDPNEELTLHQLVDRTDSPYPTVANEVSRLSGAGLLTTRRIGRTKLVRANANSPYLEPLTALVLMSFGPPLVIKEEFADVEGTEELFLFGSWAARYEGHSGPSPRDIDVLIVGTVDRDETYDATIRSERRLGREVNVTLRTPSQWSAADDAFTRQVKESPLLQLL